MAGEGNNTFGAANGGNTPGEMAQPPIGQTMSGTCPGGCGAIAGQQNTGNAQGTPMSAGCTMAQQSGTNQMNAPGLNFLNGGGMPLFPYTGTGSAYDIAGSTVTAEQLQYMNGLLRTQIGKRVTAEFIIGSSQNVTRTGVLTAVGNNYIIISEHDRNDYVVCDFYNLKFLSVYF